MVLCITPYLRKTVLRFLSFVADFSNSARGLLNCHLYSHDLVHVRLGHHGVGEDDPGGSQQASHRGSYCLTRYIYSTELWASKSASLVQKKYFDQSAYTTYSILREMSAFHNFLPAKYVTAANACDALLNFSFHFPSVVLPNLPGFSKMLFPRQKAILEIIVSHPGRFTVSGSIRSIKMYGWG